MGTPTADLPSPIALIRDPAQTRSLLDPLRRSILETLQEPGSSSSVADHLSLPRQRINYHVRSLEDEGLLVHIEDRRKGNCVERVVQAKAQRYVIDPLILNALGLGQPAALDHRFSPAAEDLLAASCHTLHEVGSRLEQGPNDAPQSPTLSLETHIRFRTPEEEVEFARRLREELDQMHARYHCPAGTEGRMFRITIGGHLAGDETQDAALNP